MRDEFADKRPIIAVAMKTGMYDVELQC